MRLAAYISTFSNTLYNHFCHTLKVCWLLEGSSAHSSHFQGSGQALEAAPALHLSWEQLLVFGGLQCQHQSNQDPSFPGRTSSPGSSKWHFPLGRGQGACPAQQGFADRQAARRAVHMKRGDSTACLGALGPRRGRRDGVSLQGFAHDKSFSTPVCNQERAALALNCISGEPGWVG